MTTDERNQKLFDRIEKEPTVTWRQLEKEDGRSYEMIRRLVTRHFRAIDKNWKKQTVQVTYVCKKCKQTFNGKSSTRYCPEHRNTGQFNGRTTERVLRHCLYKPEIGEACNVKFYISKRRLEQAAKAGSRAGVYCSDAHRLAAMSESPIKKAVRA